MSDRPPIVSDPAFIRARAMETLFERLESLCEGAIAIDRAGNVVYVNEKYLHSLRLTDASEAIGRPIEEIIPNSLMRRVAETGEPILLDIMELGGEQLVVTRMPIEDENKNIIGAIGFVLYDHLDSIKPLIARMAQLESDLRVAKRQLSQGRTARFTFDDYVGKTEGIARAKELASRAARQSVTVLLSGETGTGKELFAKAIHDGSRRAKAPFIKLNCAALPESVIESELFGHEKGAFTGAINQRKGRFELANGGTIFLDEIGEISSSFQAKLLRVLQEGEFERVGGAATIKVDTRLICATNRNLEDMVAAGTFRADLYYRINVIAIQLPPLRERAGDIPKLAQSFLEKFNEENHRQLQFEADAIDTLTRCYFPGNVRELENCVRRAASLAQGAAVSGFDLACQSGVCLSSTLWKGRGAPHQSPTQKHPTPASHILPVGALKRDTLAPAKDIDEDAPPCCDDPATCSDQERCGVSRGPNEKQKLVSAMEKAGWVQAKAARLLGLTPRQIGYALRKHGIGIERL